MAISRPRPSAAPVRNTTLSSIGSMRCTILS
jgi:hypothetical protein